MSNQPFVLKSLFNNYFLGIKQDDDHTTFFFMKEINEVYYRHIFFITLEPSVTHMSYGQEQILMKK